LQFVNVAHPQLLRRPASTTRKGVACIGGPFGLLAFEAINIYKLQVIFDKGY
jgi:hypothetical protein